MISVTPFAESPEVTAKRATVIRTTVIAAVGLAAFAFFASKLANVTGDMLSALVLACAALATLVAVLAPKSGASSHR